MFKYFVASGEIYRVSLERQSGNYFHLNEERLKEDGNWTSPIYLGVYGKGMTLEAACKRIYGYPFYFDSVKEARRCLA